MLCYVIDKGPVSANWLGEYRGNRRDHTSYQTDRRKESCQLNHILLKPFSSSNFFPQKIICWSNLQSFSDWLDTYQLLHIQYVWLEIYQLLSDWFQINQLLSDWQEINRLLRLVKDESTSFQMAKELQLLSDWLEIIQFLSDWLAINQHFSV